MLMRIRITLAGILLLFFSFTGNAQSSCSTLGQNPGTAFPVCGTTTFSQSNVPSCGGRPIPGPCGPGLADVNPFWYKFTCYTAGTLGFIISPVSPADDYDWQIFDITGRNPDDVYTDPTLFVACNWSGSLGTTGAVPSGTGLVHCAGNVPINSAMPTLVAGHEYLLMVSNWSNSQQGYSLNFSGGTAVISDPLPPSASSATANCDGTQITIRFNKKMKCSSLAANGSDFVINPGGTVISAASILCNSAFDFDSAIVVLSAPLPAGNYSISIAQGSDGSTILDNCSTPVPAGNSVPFTVAPQSALPMGTVSQPGCLPTSLTINFSEPIRCSSIAANGSDFNVTGPSTVTVTGATAVNCNANGETTSITLQLSGAITTTGNYQVQMNTGSDGNTLTGACNRQVAAGDNAPFTLAAQSPISMGTIQPVACTPSSITIDFTDPILCSSIAANGSDFTVTGPSAVQVTGAAAVNCNANGETNSIRIQFAGPILSTGAYQLDVLAGSDGNTLVGSQCGRIVPAASSASFNLAAQPAIAMGTIGTQPCAPATLTINFADSILCASIAPDGSDFTITGPTGVQVASAAGTCSANGRTLSILLTLTAPVSVDGNYAVTVNAGTDGNVLIGNCNRLVSAGSATTFDIPVAQAATPSSLTVNECAPDKVRIELNGSVRCSSIAANGSDFLISGPSTVIISSASGVCDPASGLATAIDIQLATPVVTGGNYQLQLVTGSDGNTLLNDCFRETAPFSNPFQLYDTVSAEFTYQVQFGCDSNTVDFTHDGALGVNDWSWTINGTAAGNAQAFSQVISAASNNQVELTVTNGHCSDTYSTSIVFDNKVEVDFEVPSTICPGDSAVITNLTTGLVDSWDWNFGNGNNSQAQHPAGQVYPTTGIEMLYPISLTVSNAAGCQVTGTKTITVLASCIIAVPTAFTPNGDGLNDFLYPLNAIKAEDLNFMVFNRWGQRVFHSTNWTQKWDGRVGGREQGTGVFVWTLTYRHRDTGQWISQKGTTTLIR